MNKNLLFLGFFPLSILLFFQCVHERPSGPDEVRSGQISGTLYQSNRTPAKSAVVRFLTAAHDPTALSKSAALSDSVVTDNTGAYSVASLPQGTYNLLAEGSGELLFEDSIVIQSGEPKDLGRDTLQLPGTIKGMVRLQPQHDPRNADLIFWGTTFGATPDSTGHFLIPKVPAGTFPVRVRVDVDYGVIDTEFTIVSGETLDVGVIKPPYLGVPIPTGLKAEYDTLHGRVILTWDNDDGANVAGYVVFRNDTASATPVRISGTNLVADTFFMDTIFSNPTDSGVFVYDYRLKAQDSKANQSASFSDPVEVVAVSPKEVQTTFTWKALNTIQDTASINDTIRLVVAYSNPNRTNQTLSWYLDTSKTAVRVTQDSSLSGRDTFTYSWPTAGLILVRVEMVDAGGTVWADTFQVKIILDPPTVNAGSDTIISINDTFYINFSGKDKFGTISKFRLDINMDGNFDDSSISLGRKTFLSSNIPGDYYTVVQAEDDDKIISNDTFVLHVLLDPPKADAGRDTSVKINGQLVLRGAATQTFGKVVKWEWDDGKNGNFVDVTPNSFYSINPASENKNYECVLRVTDDDNNISLDTVKIFVFDPPAGMIFVNSGTLKMGSEFNEYSKPVHSVNLSGFYLDITEVTQAEYQDLMGVNPSTFNGSGTLPVENMSWCDAVLYCNNRSKFEGLDTVYSYVGIVGTSGNGCLALTKLESNLNLNGYHLPTEAQWEYACRAGTETDFFWGPDSNGIGINAWWSGNSENITHPVAGKLPNAYGFYDMAGNVFEWINDWYGSYTNEPQKDPTGPVAGTERVVRGGSWQNLWGVGDWYEMSSFHRDSYTSSIGTRSGAVGFRCAR